jgi:hypothetical protein
MKRAVLEIGDHLFMEILAGLKSGFSGRYEVINNGLPDDVKFVRCGQSECCLNILLESETFKDIKDNEPYPILDPVTIKSVT